jgi:hypothetical protein
MSFAFAQHLEDFSQPKGLAPVSMFDTSQSSDMLLEDETEVDIDSIKSEAYQDGYNAALAELQGQHKAAEEALRIAHEQEYAALHAQLGEAMAQQIAQSAKQQLDTNCNAITQQVGHILSNFVSNELMVQAVQQLTDLIRSAFADNEAAQIRIEGPQALVDKLHEAIGDDFAKIDAQISDNAELSLEIDQALMVTRLNDWREIFGDNS